MGFRHDHGEGRFERGKWGRGPGRHGFRRGGRMFDQGDLRLIILKLIEEKPRHGYELIKAIEERLGGMYAPSPGVVYPTLTLLEETGSVAVVSTDGAKKLYGLTDEGRAFLEENKAAVDSAFGRMNAAEAMFGKGPSPRVIRAMENLKLALRLRLGAGSVTEAQADTIAEAIDAAAKAVERA
ncbi:MAG: PadR family transcriptional regulator [Caulobacterales bacterium]